MLAPPAPVELAPQAEGAQRARDGRRTAIRLFAALLLLTALLRLPAFFVAEFNSDETYLATQADVIKNGGNLYKEATDRKPPLVPYLYTATFAITGTTALWSVRVAAMFAIALTALLLALEARRRYGARAAWIAGALLVFSSVAFAPADGQAANFEVFMLPAMTAAILLARRDRAFSSGVAVAIATLAKQTGAATLLPVLYLAWKFRGRRGAGNTMLGFAIPIALVALIVGPGQLLFWSVLGNGSYLSANAISLFVGILFLVMTAGFIAPNLPILWTLPRAWRERATRDDTDLWLWLLSAAVSVAIGLRFFGHYYIQLLPPLCLLSAGMLTAASRFARLATVALAAATAAVFSIIGFFAPLHRGAQYESVSKFVAAKTSPDDRVLVWGSMPEIYWASDRRPATRFVTNSFLSGNNPGRPPVTGDPKLATPGAWDLFWEDTRLHPPLYILDTTPAKIRGSQYTPISKFPRLKALIHRSYHYVTRIDGIDIYKENSRAH